MYSTSRRPAVLVARRRASLVLPGRLMARREGAGCGILRFRRRSFSTVLSMRVPISIYGTSWRRFGLVAQLAVLLFTALAAADLAAAATDCRSTCGPSWWVGADLALWNRPILGWDPGCPRTPITSAKDWTIVRPPGTLGYVSHFANYMVFAVFLGVALYSIEKALVERGRAIAASRGFCYRAE
jgi:hypothetical protein